MEKQVVQFVELNVVISIHYTERWRQLEGEEEIYQEVIREGHMPGRQNGSKGPAKDWMFVCPPQNPYVGSSPSQVMVFGIRAFGRSLGLDEVRRVKPPWWDYPYTKKVKRLEHYLSHHVKTQQEGDCLLVRKRALTQGSTILTPWSWNFQPWNWESKCLLFKPTKFMITCYNSLKHLLG